MSVHRLTPNKQQDQTIHYCTECQHPDQYVPECKLSPVFGYWIYSDRMSESVFICDNCLKQARKLKAYRHTPESQP